MFLLKECIVIKILGIDDSVNTCDCCGKTGLKSTVLVESFGKVYHYGSVCATKHTGLTDKEIRKEIKEGKDGVVSAARKEYHGSTQYLLLQAKISAAHREKIKPGKTFRDYLGVLVDEAETVRIAVARKYGVRSEALL